MLTVAVDGPGGAGKGELSRGLARALDFAFLDTGLLYRAVAYAAIESDASADDDQILVGFAKTISPESLKNPILRSDAVAQMASKISARSAVRDALLDYQRRFASCPPGNVSGVILDGRDIGTKILPQADIKFYLTARPEVRAERRFRELKRRGIETSYAEVLQEMHQRDARDQNREASPLKPATDAYIMDTSDLTIDEAVNQAIEMIRVKMDHTSSHSYRA